VYLNKSRRIAADCDIPLQTGKVGTMFSYFFTGKKVKDYESAKTSDTARYARCFHALLEQGVYMAPSQFESGFVSAAHTPDVIDRTLSAFRAIMPTLLQEEQP
jgi:glutamate-1-semialdehyde 2,1-aminomutase